MFYLCFEAASLKASAILPIVTDVSTCGPSVCLSVTLAHPAKAIGQNEMPFGKDTVVIPCNTVLNWGPGSPREGGFGVGSLSLQ